MSAFDTQVGGGHYKELAIQPMQYSMANKLDACQHTIIKYVTRFRQKGGFTDLQKARHVIDMLIELEKVKAEAKVPDDEAAATKVPTPVADASAAAIAGGRPKATDPLREALIAAMKERFGDDIVVRVLED
mgnify:CR=1 FL=1